MKNIYLIRHGETEFNRSHLMQGRGINASLNNMGRMQAIRISEFLKDNSITKIITSSLNRAIESAEPLREYFGQKVESYSDLDEMDFGNLEGKPFEEVKEDLEYLHTNWSTGNLKVSPKNGENPIEVFDRANTKVDTILNSIQDKQVVFILHGRLIRILLSKWLGLGLKNMHQIKHQNGAINHLTWVNGNFKEVELNVTSHLDDLS